MMKQSHMLRIFLLLTISIQPVTHTAMSDIVREKAERTRQAFSQKTIQLQQLIARLQQTIQNNKNCLLNGICETGQKESMITLVKQMSITVAALIIIAAAAVVATKMISSGDDTSVTEKVRAVSIKNIAQKHGVSEQEIPTDDSPPGLFIRAVQNGVPTMVQKMADLVSDKVLRVGKELAQVQRALYANESSADVRRRLQNTYDQITTTIDTALRTYQESNLHKNIQFIYAATTGLLEEVKARLCDIRLTPSKNAIEEAVQRIRSKTAAIYKEIVAFINNPRCEK